VLVIVAVLIFVFIVLPVVACATRNGGALSQTGEEPEWLLRSGRTGGCLVHLGKGQQSAGDDAAMVLLSSAD